MAVGDELREGRLSTALTQEDVGDAAGISHAEVSRIERGASPHVPYERLVVLATVLGLDLPLRTYPSGEPVRDRAQIELLARFRRLLPAGLTWRTEVPLAIEGDRRAWDAVVGGTGWRLPIDAESRLRDVQALSRREALKRRDDRSDVMVLLVAGSRHNRSVLRLAQPDLAGDFPVQGRVALAALAAGARPLGSAIIVI
jgi:transcriptional regulator with XRE-family HTH domain